VGLETDHEHMSDAPTQRPDESLGSYLAREGYELVPTTTAAMNPCEARGQDSAVQVLAELCCNEARQAVTGPVQEGLQALGQDAVQNAVLRHATPASWG
jgi:hypothetical protein